MMRGVDSGSGHVNTWFYRGLEAGERAIGDGPRNADAAQRAHDALDALLAADPNIAECADCTAGCTLGCTPCCHLPVHAAPAEAELLARHLRANLGEAEFLDLRERVITEAVWRCEAGRKRTAEARRPCPLLDAHGHCVAYAARPLACRGLFSASSTACALDQQSATGGSLPVPYYWPAWSATRGVLSALGDGGELVEELAPHLLN